MTSSMTSSPKILCNDKINRSMNMDTTNCDQLKQTEASLERLKTDLATLLFANISKKPTTSTILRACVTSSPRPLKRLSARQGERLSSMEWGPWIRKRSAAA